MAKKVALVTGSQQGIGFCLVKMLCKSFDGDVIVTGESEEAATKARTELEGEGSKPVSHQLDVTDQASVEKLRDFIKEKYGGLDILINNAGISFKVEALKTRNLEIPPELAFTTVSEIVEKTVGVNFFGAARVCDVMFPLLRPGARVVHMSSNGARAALKMAAEVKRKRLSSPDLTKKDIIHLVAEYFDDAKAGKDKENGWPVNGSYCMSKWALIALGKAQQREFDNDSRSDIIVNCACPGLVATPGTDFMGGPVEQGCDTALYLATLPTGTDSPKGEFVFERKVCSLTDAGHARPEAFSTMTNHWAKK